MKVLTISASDTGVGGASRIALDLHAAYEKRGITAHFLSGTGSQTRKNFHKVPGQFFRKLAGKLVANDLEHYNSDFIFNTPYYQAADIVHFHNIHGGYFNLSTFVRVCAEKKVVWTLHDQWSMTPHCAYSSEAEPKNGFYTCESLKSYPGLLWDNTAVLQNKKRAFYEQADFTVVTPSRWLQGRAVQSVLGLKPIHCIPNGINTDIFYPREKSVARSALNLSTNKTVVLFIAAGGLDNEFKGGDIVRQLIKENQDQYFLVVGKRDKAIETEHSNVTTMDAVKDQDRLASIYSAVDMTIVPSKHEVLGLVAVESIACGAPVAVADVGGLRETVINDTCGMVVDERTSSAMSEAITLVTNQHLSSDRDKIHQFVRDTFSIDAMADGYLALYNELL